MYSSPREQGTKQEGVIQVCSELHMSKLLRETTGGDTCTLDPSQASWEERDLCRVFLMRSQDPAATLYSECPEDPVAGFPNTLYVLFSRSFLPHQIKDIMDKDFDKLHEFVEIMKVSFRCMPSVGHMGNDGRDPRACP